MKVLDIENGIKFEVEAGDIIWGSKFKGVAIHSVKEQSFDKEHGFDVTFIDVDGNVHKWNEEKDGGVMHAKNMYASYSYKLSNGYYLSLWYSDDEAWTEGCDACLGYTLYDENRQEIDGGSMEYDSKKEYRYSAAEAIDDLIAFVFDDEAINVSYERYEGDLD